MDTQERQTEEQKAARERAEKEAAKQRAKKAAEYRKRYFDYYDDVKNHGDGILKNIEW